MQAPLIFVVILLAGIVVFAAFVRLAPSDPADWHVDPFAARAPGAGGWLLGPEGDAPALHVDAAPARALSVLAEIAAETPRVTVLAGSAESGCITWVARSALWGFPDYVTAGARPAPGGGSDVAILSRLRFGKGDMGVNRRRVADWSRALADRVPRT